MTTLLIAEHDNAHLKDATHKALSAAKALGTAVHVLVAGANAKAAAEAAATLDQPYDAIVAAATTTGKNVLPRVAALLDVMQISDITKVISPDTFERPIYAGNALQTVQSGDAKKVITVRISAFPAAAEGGAAPIETVAA